VQIDTLILQGPPKALDEDVVQVSGFATAEDGSPRAEVEEIECDFNMLVVRPVT
jgi:hypothetical protein